ncbi:MAG: hypothetical protein EXS05_13405 [Planctomycetaceae bacterium]|nr:hypothetical protein [Planctomycetaceae bacterium]
MPLQSNDANVIPNHGNVRIPKSGRYFATLLMLAVAAITCRAALSQSDEAKPKVAFGARKPTAVAANAPQYNEQGDLKRPTDFETWVFVGANLGIEYRDDATEAPPKAEAEKKTDVKPVYSGNFHNVYINPEAYETYVRTGKFPDRTMFVLDIYKAEAGKPKDVVAEGRFPGKASGIAVAVKNKSRPDGSKTEWAYYDFGLEEPSAKAFPNNKCYDCHLQHADDDCVWVQFYPTLLKARDAREKRAAGGGK